MVTHAVEPLALFSVIVAEGPDAETFLQGQLTNSLQSLTPQTHQRTGYCSAKGRLLAIAQAWSIDPQAFGLLLPTELAGPITRRLGMYILRAKARLSVATADVSAVWNSPEPLAEGQLRNLGGGVFQLGFANCPVRGARSLEVRLRPATNSARPSEPSPNGLEANPLSGQPSGVGANTNAWALADVRSGTPWIWTQTQDLFVPQMINLELVGGVDFKKGCYPGQEVVARSQYLGRLNRRMFGLEWPATEDPVLPGSPVWSPA
ncbi:MAG: hypothetical protein RLZZ344_1355, partial [Pseudomonadota bacterium]